MFDNKQQISPRFPSTSYTTYFIALDVLPIMVDTHTISTQGISPFHEHSIAHTRDIPLSVSEWKCRKYVCKWLMCELPVTTFQGMNHIHYSNTWDFPLSRTQYGSYCRLFVQYTVSSGGIEMVPILHIYMYPKSRENVEFK